jgi:hypothetical protein
VAADVAIVHAAKIGILIDAFRYGPELFLGDNLQIE